MRLFEDLSNLKELRLYNNKLKRIDSNIFNGLTKLERLEFYENEIEEIDVSSSERSKEFQDPYIGLFLNDRYEIKKKLGKGAFGTVYLVYDTKIDIK